MHVKSHRLLLFVVGLPYHTGYYAIILMILNQRVFVGYMHCIGYNMMLYGNSTIEFTRLGNPTAVPERNYKL